jgi:hypothetical protein
MTNETIRSGDWTFKNTRAQQWQILCKGKHFAYVSTDAMLRALAAL